MHVCGQNAREKAVVIVAVDAFASPGAVANRWHMEHDHLIHL